MHDLQSICLLLDLILMLRGALCSGLSSDCTPNINLPKNSKAGQTQNQPLSLRCPVTLCSLDEPIVTWCRVERRGNSQCEIVKPDDRISSGWEEKTKNEAVHVLKFQFVQLNDTGFYQCLVAFKEMQIVGSVIEVTLPAQPSVSLEINSAGFPECRASDGLPAAEISWIPQSNNISTTSIIEANGTWTVISIYRMQNVIMVRCLVSHPTFETPQENSIMLPAQPSVTLEINCAGIPECTAHGAYPAAEISWTPQTDKITTEHFQHDNKTWTSISKYNLKNVTMVTCRVSHPTFTSPQEKSIILKGTEGKHFSWKIPAYIIFLVITFTLFIFMKIKTKTICCQKKSGEHHHTKVIEIPPTSEEVIDPRSLQSIHEASPEDNNPFQAGDLM